MLRQFYKNGIEKRRAKTALIVVVFVLLIAVVPVFGQNNHESHALDSSVFTPEIWGLEYGVSNIKKAVDFYTEVLGFEIEDNICCEPSTVLKNGPLHLILVRSDASLPSDSAAKVILNMSIGDFKTVIETSRLRGGKVVDETRRQFAHGMYVEIQDPFGNKINLIKLDGENMSPASKPALFNIGVTQKNLEKAEAFYTILGFTPFSRDYLPIVLPLNKSGAAMLILHDSAIYLAEIGTRKGTILLSTRNLETTVHLLESRGLIPEKSKNHSSRDFAMLRDPSGNQLKIMELLSASNLESASLTPSLVPQEWSRLQKDVWETVESYTEASHQRNLEKYLSFWHPDFLGWHNGDSKPTNHQQRAKGLKYYFDSTTSLEYKLEPKGIQIIADGVAAIVHYELRSVLQIKASGKKEPGQAYWTDYLVYENGKWLLISDHGGSVPEIKQ